MNKSILYLCVNSIPWFMPSKFDKIGKGVLLEINNSLTEEYPYHKQSIKCSVMPDLHE